MAREQIRDAQGQTQGVDRREFLSGGAAAIVMLGIAPWLVASTPGDPAGPFTKARFRALVSQWFHVGASSWEPVQLVAVLDGPVSQPTEQFTLVFRTAGGEALPEGTYTVAPPTGDTFALFLQPGEASGSDATLSANFNLLPPAPLAPACAGAA